MFIHATVPSYLSGLKSEFDSVADSSLPPTELSDFDPFFFLTTLLVLTLANPDTILSFRLEDREGTLLPLDTGKASETLSNFDVFVSSYAYFCLIMAAWLL